MQHKVSRTIDVLFWFWRLQFYFVIGDSIDKFSTKDEERILLPKFVYFIYFNCIICLMFVPYLFEIFKRLNVLYIYLVQLCIETEGLIE